MLPCSAGFLHRIEGCIRDPSGECCSGMCAPAVLCLRVQWLAIEIERKRGAERERESELERDGEARTRSYLNTQYINHF